MSNRYQAGILLPGYNALKVPCSPLIGNATPASNTTVSVTFTAPSCIGGGAISSYQVFACCGARSSFGSSSPLVVSGLTSGTAYTFKSIATNAFGPSYPSAASNSATTWTVPGAPTIGTATIVSQTASVPFTAPASNGGTAITSYTATSSPGSITGTLSQAGSGTITVSGLTGGTSYTFTVTATNSVGTGPASAASNSVTAVTQGQQAFTSPGEYTWIAPTSVTSVSVVVIGKGGSGGGCYNSCPRGGGGGGGGLAYKNGVTVTPGTGYTVEVTNTGYAAVLGVRANQGANASGTSPGVGGTATGGTVNYTGGTGRTGAGLGGGGGGAGGYVGNGLSSPCAGGGTYRIGGNSGDGNPGGTSGGQAGAGGGGSSLISSGTAVASPGCSGHSGGIGASFGGGGGGNGAFGAGGAGGANGVRILWGPGRAYPNTNTGDL